MNTVVFLFDFNQKVKTLLGEIGIIDSIGVNKCGKPIYFVLTASNSYWFDENVLIAAG